MATKARGERGPVEDIQSEGKRAAQQAAYSPLMETLTRIGYAVKGVIYILIGVLALEGVTGKNHSPADQVGAIVALSKLPAGEVIMWIVLIGLIAYSLWGFIRAILDPYHKGHDLKGIAARIGYVISGLTYAFFVLPTYDLIKGARHSSSAGSGSTQKIVAQVMSMPFGAILVGAFGVAAIAAGVYQIYSGLNSTFDRQFKSYALTPDQYKTVIQAGRFGTAARGVVFALVGFFLCLAAVYHNPSQAKGFSGALTFLGHQPYGLWLLGIIAVGLIAFGVYSLISAAWLKMRRESR